MSMSEHWDLGFTGYLIVLPSLVLTVNEQLQLMCLNVRFPETNPEKDLSMSSLFGTKPRKHQ